MNNEHVVKIKMNDAHLLLSCLEAKSNFRMILKFLYISVGIACVLSKHQQNEEFVEFERANEHLGDICDQIIISYYSKSVRAERRHKKKIIQCFHIWLSPSGHQLWCHQHQRRSLLFCNFRLFTLQRWWLRWCSFDGPLISITHACVSFALKWREAKKK